MVSLWAAVAQLALAVVNFLFRKKEDREAWKKAIEDRLATLESQATGAATMRADYDRLQKELSEPKQLGKENI